MPLPDLWRPDRTHLPLSVRGSEPSAEPESPVEDEGPVSTTPTPDRMDGVDSKILEGVGVGTRSAG